MSSNNWQAGSGRATTYWRACDPSTGIDYAGTEIAHTQAGLTLGYFQYREVAAEAKVGEATAPVDLATADAAAVDWGWGRVAGPFYRADFPAASLNAGAPAVQFYVTGVESVFFQRVALDEIFPDDPFAASITEPVDATVVGIDELAATSIATEVVEAAQASGVALDAATQTALTKAVFRALHYTDGYGLRRLTGDTGVELLLPDEPSPVPVSIDVDAGRPTVIAAGAGAE